METGSAIARIVLHRENGMVCDLMGVCGISFHAHVLSSFVVLMCLPSLLGMCCWGRLGVACVRL